MLDVADLLVLAFPRIQQFFEPALALGQRQRAKILAIGKQQVERVEDQILGLAIGQRGLQRREIRRAVVIERDDLAVDHHVRQCAAVPGDGGELFGPVEAFAGFQGRLAVLDAQLHAVAVELDLMAPAVSARRAFDGGAELRCDEIRYCRDLFWLRRFRRRTRPWRRRLGLCPRLGGLPAVGLPDRIGCGLARPFVASMNGFGAFPLPSAICSIDRPEATDLSSSRISLSHLPLRIRRDA